MPRLTTSKLGTVLAFFRSATMEIAEAGFDLARDIIRERKQTAEKIRAGQSKNKKQPQAAPAAAIPAGVVGKGAGQAPAGTRKRKRNRKRTPAPAAAAPPAERRKRTRNRATAAAQETVPPTEAELPLAGADDDFVAEPEGELVPGR